MRLYSFGTYTVQSESDGFVWMVEKRGSCPYQVQMTPPLREALREIERLQDEVDHLKSETKDRPERLLKSGDVARMTGVCIKTLARWRSAGEGPDGWSYTSPTQVVYTAESVERFLRKRFRGHSANVKFNFEKKGASC